MNRPTSAICGLLVLPLLAALTAGCSTSAPQDDLRRVSIAATTFPASAPIYVAEEKGFFEAQGLDVEVHTYDAGRLALAEAVAGRVDFATVAETPIVESVLAGHEFNIISTIAEMDRANYIVARADRGIRSAGDLRGKRVGVIPRTTGDFFLNIYLTASLIEPSSVKRVEVEPNEIVEMLLDGRVDAVSAWPPFTTELRDALGDDAVVLDEPGLYVMSWNVVVPADQSHEEDSERFLRALLEAETYVEEHPDECLEITARRTGVGETALSALWPDFHWRVSLDQQLLLSLESEARWLISESRESRGTPDFLGHVDDTALSAISTDRVTIIELGE